MKKSSTTITPMLLKSRSKGDTFQVVIRINHDGRYYLNVGNIYARESDWDSTHHRLKKKYPNSEILNKMIADKVYEIEQRLYSFLQSKKVFTAKMLCEEKSTKANSLFVSDLADNLCNDRNLTESSHNNYKLTLRRLKKFMEKENTLITEMTAPMLRKFADHMKVEMGLADGTIQISISHIASLWNYAISKRLVSRADYPMDEWRYLEDYKQKPHHIALSTSHFTLLENYFISNYIVVDQAAGAYNYKNYKNHITLKTNELCLSLFLIGYRMQGLALADLLSIKMNQISFITRGDTEYMVISDVKRQKTGVAVEIVVEMDDMANALLRVYLDTASERDGWLFPVYSDLKFKRITDKVVNNARGYCTTLIANVVSAIGQELNESVLKDDEDKFPSRITYYTCRHSFATHFMEKSGNIMALSVMLGHDVMSTTNYVKELKSIDTLIETKKDLFK